MSPALNGDDCQLVQQRRCTAVTDELLLALDAAEVGAPGPSCHSSVAALLVVTAAGVGERLHAVEDLAPRLQVEPGVDVAGRQSSTHISTPPMRVDDALEAEEVDLDVVVDRDAERSV